MDTTPTPPRFAGLLNLIFGFGMLAVFATASILGIQWVKAQERPVAPATNTPLIVSRSLPVPGANGLFVQAMLVSYEKNITDIAAPAIMRNTTVFIENDMVVVRFPVGVAIHSYSSGGPEIAGAKVGNPDE